MKTYFDLIKTEYKPLTMEERRQAAAYLEGVLLEHLRGDADPAVQVMVAELLEYDLKMYLDKEGV